MNAASSRTVWIDALAGGVVLLMLALWAVTRFTGAAETPPPPMPSKVTNEAERSLYLTPGGLYTEADIAANGRQTASQTFAGFIPQHDTNPQPGDTLCPITQTKANAACTWIIGGERYAFCCPPCIDEFLHQAKTAPEEIHPPGHYVQPSL